MRNIAITALAIYTALAIGLLLNPPASIAFDRLVLALLFVPVAAFAIWLRHDWATRMRREKQRRDRLAFPPRAPEDEE